MQEYHSKNLKQMIVRTVRKVAAGRNVNPYLASLAAPLNNDQWPLLKSVAAFANAHGEYPVNRRS
jgi:hypothetical protein